MRSLILFPIVLVMAACGSEEAPAPVAVEVVTEPENATLSDSALCERQPSKCPQPETPRPIIVE